MNEIQIFQNVEFGAIRTMSNEQGEVMFCAKDVAVALGYKLARKAVQDHVDKDDVLKRNLIDSLGRKQLTTFINESGLYSLILSSKLDSARRFKHWVTSEVRWSLLYDLWCKMRFFGRAIEAQEESDESTQSKGPQNLLDLLPEIFTREEASAMRQRIGIRNDSLSQMLNNWKQRRYIEVYGEEVKRSEVSRQRYIKTEEYLRKHPQRDVTQYSVFS